MRSVVRNYAVVMRSVHPDTIGSRIFTGESSRRCAIGDEARSVAVNAQWMTTHPARPTPPYAPCFHATHEDGTWHIWMLMLFLQLPLVVYFAVTSRREFRKVAPIVLAQGMLWALALLAGGFQPGWA